MADVDVWHYKLTLLSEIIDSVGVGDRAGSDTKEDVCY